MAAGDYGEQDGSQGTTRPLRVLVDTNVALDQLLQRDPWYAAAQSFWRARDTGRLVAYLSASTLTDISYIGRRHAGPAQARQAVERCLREFGLVPVSRTVLEAALALGGPDFEDDVQIACAQLAGLDLIVTRDAAGFRHAPLPAIEPADIVSYLSSTHDPPS